MYKIVWKYHSAFYHIPQVSHFPGKHFTSLRIKYELICLPLPFPKPTKKLGVLLWNCDLERYKGVQQSPDLSFSSKLLAEIAAI